MESLLAAHTTLAIDSCVWIYHFEAHEQYGPLARTVLRCIQDGPCEGLSSEVTLVECIVQPLRLNRQDAADHYELVLDHFPNFRLVPVTRAVLVEAASIRAAYGFRTPDAIIVATALLHGATLLVSNDVRLKQVRGIEVLCLQEYLEAR